MNWPVYPHAGISDELDRHAQRVADGAQGNAGAFTLALDVWRGGVHLWRSYGPEHSSTCADWAEQELPAGTAANFDDGIWRANGLPNVHLWPIPTLAALRPVESMAALRDILATVLAIGQLPDFPPAGLDLIPPESTFATRSRRSNAAFITWSFFEPFSGVTVRAVIGRQAAPEVVDENRQFVAKLERRETRNGIGDATFKEQEVVISAPDKPNHIVRAAKAAMGLTGWAAQRQGHSLTWHLTGAPYRLVIHPT